jgi:Tfp pilus assembly protein PilE
MGESSAFPSSFAKVVRKSLGEVIPLYFLPITLLEPRRKAHNVTHIFKTFRKRIKVTYNHKTYHPKFSFTMIEVMIIVAIIGIISTIVTPYFINYRYKSRIASIIDTGEGIRAAFATYVSSEHHVPKETDVLKDISALSYCHKYNYKALDTDNDGAKESYKLLCEIPPDPKAQKRITLIITPDGITQSEDDK